MLNKFYKKSVSPLIATILLVVVAVVLVTILLNFGKDFTLTSLEKVKNSELIENKDLLGYITVQSAVEGYDKATILLNNTHKEKNITIVAYKIIDDDYQADFIDKRIDLNQSIDLNANSNVQFPIYFFPSTNFDLYLITEENTYIKVNVTPNKRDYDNFKLKEGLILDMPLQEPYTKLGDDLITPLDFTTDWVVVNAEIDSANTFHTTSAGGIRINDILEEGKLYNIIIEGTSSVGTLSLHEFDGTAIKIDILNNNNFTFTQLDTTGIYLRNDASSDIEITKLEIREINGVTQDRTYYENNGNVNGATLTYDGLVNMSNGIAYIPSDTAYGTWEFNVYKAIGTNPYIYFTKSDTVGRSLGDGYELLINAAGKIYFNVFNDGIPFNLFQKYDGYIDEGSDYRIKITRSLTGVFKVYIKGGRFGWSDWTTVGTAIDNTYTSSNYFVIDIDNGDKISNLKINDKPIKLSNVTVSSGVYTTTAPSYDFDGIDDYIDLGMNIPSDLTGDLTISTWINPAGWGGATNGNIINNGKLVCFVSSAGDIRFSSNSSIYMIAGAGDIILNENKHVLITRSADGSNTNIYVNGILSGSSNQNSGVPRVGTTNTIIGNRFDTARPFNGQISNFKIWNRILSENEIDLIFNKEKGIYNVN